MTPERQEALLTEYKEASNNFRTLTDIRFRLLTLLPIATAAAAVIKADAWVSGAAVLSLFGLIITIALITYNARNDQLYDALIGRAALIERMLGIPDGAFASRPQAWLSLRLGGRAWKVSHRPAVGLLYGATSALWLFMLLQAVIVGIWGDVLVLKLTALVIAVVLVARAQRWITTQTKEREDELRSDVGQAVDILLATERRLPITRDAPTDRSAKDRTDAGPMLQMVREDPAFLSLCVRISGENKDKLTEKMRAYSVLDANSLGLYVPSCGEVDRAAALLSLIVDLPPHWIADVRTNRRGTVPAMDWRPPESRLPATSEGSPH